MITFCHIVGGVGFSIVAKSDGILFGECYRRGSLPLTSPFPSLIGTYYSFNKGLVIGATAA